MLIRYLKDIVGDALESRALDKHKSTIGWRIAPMYTRHHLRCRRNHPTPSSSDQNIRQAADRFHSEGFTWYWDERNSELARSIFHQLKEQEQKDPDIWKRGETPNIANFAGDIYQNFPEIEQILKGKLGHLLQDIFGCQFNVFFGVMHRSERTQDEPAASQLWHGDSGPGICINVLFYLHETTENDGAIELLPWNDSVEILRARRRYVRKWLRDLEKEHRKHDRMALRKLSTDFFTECINVKASDKIVQPIGQAGLAVLFRNNTIHKGGFPAPGMTRYAFILHCYPSAQAPDFVHYRENGILKKASCPKDLSKELR